MGLNSYCFGRGKNPYAFDGVIRTSDGLISGGPIHILPCSICPDDTTPITRYDSEYVKCCDEVSPGVIVPYFTLFQHDDEQPGTVTPMTVDGAGNPYTPVNPVLCPDNEFKEHVVEHCWQDASDCTVTYRQILCLNLDTGSVVSSLWLDANAQIIAAPASVQPCDAKLGPYMANAIGQANPVFEPFNTFAIHKPDCCELTVTTSAGSITLPANQTHYSSDTFGCLLTSLTISGPCVAETTVFVNRTY